MRQKFSAAGLCILITALAASIGHLVAAFTAPAFSPVLIVGSRMIDLAPTPLKTFAVETFGTADKPILLGSIAVGIALVVGAIGFFLKDSPRLVYKLLTLVSLFPLALVFTARGFTPLAVVPALALVAVAQLSLYYWHRLLMLNSLPLYKPASLENLDSPPAVARRKLLANAGVFALGAVVAGSAGVWVTKTRTAIGAIKLPAPLKALTPKRAELDSVRGITKLVTPTDKFYRVDINLAVPVVDHTTWKLELKRKGYETLTYSYADILKMDLVERDITLVCVSNTVGGKYVSSGRWLGVDLKKLLEPLEPTKGSVDQIFATSTDGYTSSSDLALAVDGREAMIAVGLNGKPLPRDHGFPARLLIPGVYGFVGATKWLASLELTTYAEKSAYWTDRKWATDAPVKPMTRIDTPRSFSEQEVGEGVVAGVAWAGIRGVASVQVKLDSGSWQNAMIGEASGGQNKPGSPGVTSNDSDYWVQWMLPVKLSKGSHTVQARCITKDGEMQTEERAESFPNGASGIQSIVFSAS